MKIIRFDNRYRKYYNIVFCGRDPHFKSIDDLGEWEKFLDGMIYEVFIRDKKFLYYNHITHNYCTRDEVKNYLINASFNDKFNIQFEDKLK